jgi:lambda family phage portal protein
MLLDAPLYGSVVEDAPEDPAPVEARSEPAQPPVLTMAALPTAPIAVSKWDDGEKFYGGFGDTQILVPDYWTLRARSAQLFETNLYARGIIRRFITNEINTGLHLESSPIESVLGLEQDALGDWSEDVENRWSLWEGEPYLCDFHELGTFGALQRVARMEALVSGDVLCVLMQDPRTDLPRLRLVSGALVQTPVDATPQKGNRIVHGVELDAQGRQVAYWIQQANFAAGRYESKRLPAFGEKSGRKIAWLVYGTERRLDQVRGKPFLALMLQALREIDRYKDATLRKAVINSMLAMFVTKTEDKPGTRPISGGGAHKRTQMVVDSEGKTRSFRTAELMPGLVIDELQKGEEPKAFPNQGTDEKFGAFEEAIVATLAWTSGYPPEILRLTFSSNYSASQAAVNELNMHLNVVRTAFGQDFCAPVYQEWLVSMVLLGKIRAPGLLEAWRDFYGQHDTYCAWVFSDWSGHIKPAMKLNDQVGGYAAEINIGAITHDRAARELTGMKFSRNVKLIAREAKLLAAALKPLKELEAAAKPKPAAPPSKEPSRDEDEPDEPKDGDEDDGADAPS